MAVRKTALPWTPNIVITTSYYLFRGLDELFLTSKGRVLTESRDSIVCSFEVDAAAYDSSLLLAICSHRIAQSVSSSPSSSLMASMRPRVRQLTRSTNLPYLRIPLSMACYADLYGHRKSTQSPSVPEHANSVLQTKSPTTLAVRTPQGLATSYLQFVFAGSADGNCLFWSVACPKSFRDVLQLRGVLFLLLFDGCVNGCVVVLSLLRI